MATKNTTVELVDFIKALNELTTNFLAANGLANVEAEPAKKATRSRRGTKAVEPEPEDVDEDDDDADDEAPSFTEAELKKLKPLALKKLAKQYFEDDAVAEATTADLIESLLSLGDEDDEDPEDDEDEDDADVDDDADEDEDDDDEDDDAEEDDRETLLELSIGDLRKKARDEYEATPKELKGLDKDGIVDLILGAEDEDDADVDVNDDEDEEGYTEDELEAMDTAELKEICDTWGIEYTPKARAAGLIKKILEAQEEGEEE